MGPMSRVWLVLVLTVASATAWAQPARQGGATPTTPAAAGAATASAQTAVSTIERRVGALATRRSQLAVRYDAELRGIRGLKQQRKSWRRDRELQSRLADANETAKQLEAITRDLAAGQRQLAAARRTLIAAVDAELAAGPNAARAAYLGRLKVQLAPPARRAPSRIVLPDTEVDLNADPEDLDQQAAQLRDSELELQRQIIGLEKQATELDRVALLRKNHERAGILDRRDDDQPTRSVQQPGGGRDVAATAEDQGPPNSPAPDSGGGGGGTGGTDTSTGGGGEFGGGQLFESEASVVLADVVDTATIEALTKAARSGDPKQRAAAVKKTRDAVAQRLEQLRRKRALVEQRAKQLRK